jgi:lysophospholipase L1-like esterase
MRNLFQPENIYRLVLVVVGVLIALAIIEFGLRIAFPEPTSYYVWRPNLERTFRPYPGAMPGINGDSRFFINSTGIRGDEFAGDQQYRILCIGGSTTECMYLDQTEAWPYLLQEKLNGLNTLKVWVGNVGKSACGTPDYILQMEHLLPQYPQLDAIILLIGANEGAPESVYAYPLDHAFAIHPFEDKPFPQNTALWRLGHRFFILLNSRTNWDTLFTVQVKEVQEQAGKWYIDAREQRAQAEIVDEMPDLTPLLDEYGENLNTIIDMAKAESIRLICMTFPSIYREDLTEQERALLWGGPTDETQEKYYSVRVLMERAKQINSKTIDVCQSQGVECIDLANLLPKDTTVFYDDLHYNESGAQLIAQAIFEYLSDTEPFNHTGEIPQ